MRAQGYNHAWERYSQEFRAAHPLCGERADGQLHTQNSRCARLGLNGKAQVVNHIMSPKQGGAFMDPSNHEGLCRACNARHAIANGLSFFSPLADCSKTRDESRGGLESVSAWG